MGQIDPCKKIIGPVNKVMDGIDSIVRRIITTINMVIGGINADLVELVIMFNLGIELFNEFVGGFLSKFNDIMNDCKNILQLFVSITSGTIIGWFYLFYSTIITIAFGMTGIDMDLATLLTWIRYVVYLMLIGNVYNVFDLMSSKYSPTTNTLGNCNTY